MLRHLCIPLRILLNVVWDVLRYTNKALAAWDPPQFWTVHECILQVSFTCMCYNQRKISVAVSVQMVSTQSLGLPLSFNVLVKAQGQSGTAVAIYSKPFLYCFFSPHFLYLNFYSCNLCPLFVVVTQNACAVVAHQKLMLGPFFCPSYICSIKDTLCLFANTFPTPGPKRKQIRKTPIKIQGLLPPIPQPISTDPTPKWQMLATCMHS